MIANQRINWDKVVDKIIQAAEQANIVEEKKSSGDSTEEEIDKVFEEISDLQKILDLNQVSIKKAQEIETVYLEPIRKQIEKEIRTKLSLTLNLKLHGAVTWVATVICWYKLSNKVVMQFNEQLDRFEGQKEKQREIFFQIASGGA